jgi:DNA-binding transcriptional ArsR family regulator
MPGLPSAERLFRILADENRLRLVSALADGERSVSEVLETTGLPQTLASFHLRTLRENGLVKAERRGAFVYYRLADPSLVNLLEAAEKYAGSLPQTSEEKGPVFRWPPWAAMCRMKGIR